MHYDPQLFLSVHDEIINVQLATANFLGWCGREGESFSLLSGAQIQLD